MALPKVVAQAYGLPRALVVAICFFERRLNARVGVRPATHVLRLLLAPHYFRIGEALAEAAK